MTIEIEHRSAAHATEAGGQPPPRLAALLAQARLPEPEPPAWVTYRSQGRLLIVGPAAPALHWATALQGVLQVSVLVTAGVPSAGSAATFPIHAAGAVAIAGWLGRFQAVWQPTSQAREQAPAERREEFDMVFDLSASPLIALHQPPQGYFHAADVEDAARIAAGLGQMTGEFEKPTFFRYKDSLCTHSRNRVNGCDACIEICSARAIAGDGDRIRVNPYLCVGCGACTTVCPSGAIAYAYPDAPQTGLRLKTLLSTYAEAGGREALLLLHSGGRGGALLQAAGGADALPERMLPLALHHTASVGIELWLLALAYGAAGVAVLTTDEEAPDYVAALREQMEIAQAIMSGFGYGGRHFHLLQAGSAAELAAQLAPLAGGHAPAEAARFHAAADKRNTLDMALNHLYRHAPDTKSAQFALPTGAPLGAVAIDADACTLCMACAGACPKSALMAGGDLPQLRFIEKNCVQCGLCVQTCPERAIRLVPRLSMDASAKSPAILNETQPFHCIRCNKPFGTLKAIENMIARLTAHEAFRDNPERLRMCGDCRVVDMMMSGQRQGIAELKRPSV
jgi:ferredoxin